MEINDTKNYTVLLKENANRSFALGDIFYKREFIPFIFFVLIFGVSNTYILCVLSLYICLTLYRIKRIDNIKKNLNLGFCNNGLIIDNQFYHFTEIEEILVNRYFQKTGFILYKIDHLGFSLLLKNGTVIKKMIDDFDKSNLLTVYLNKINLNIHEGIYDFHLFKPLNLTMRTEKFDTSTFRNKPFENEIYSKPDLNLDFYYKGNQLCIRKNRKIDSFHVINFEDIDYLEFFRYEDALTNDGYVIVYFIDLSVRNFYITKSVELSTQLCRDLNFKIRYLSN